MTWTILLIIALLVFSSRFLLLEPWLPLRLSKNTKDFLSYSAPAVLTAIAAPIIFVRQDQLNLSLHNPYLSAGLIVVAIALLSRNTLVTVVAGMVAFVVLTQVI